MNEGLRFEMEALPKCQDKMVFPIQTYNLLILYLYIRCEINFNITGKLRLGLIRTTSQLGQLKSTGH
ncbi:hypothetical protein Sjap_023744 [Stephania japonica]|uniref:Uncharacterized protein n=1 Tax=Stephania japonica TaxID=461633 RepID=A0AAP0HN08_9MAGN